MNFRLEHFLPLVNSVFIIHTQVGPLELTLFSAEELPRGQRPASLPTPLSLIFSSPANWQFKQDNFAFEHATLGKQQHVWCMVPIIPPRAAKSSDDIARNYYQVMFN